MNSKTTRNRGSSERSRLLGNASSARPVELVIPTDLTVTRLDFGQETLVVFSFQLPPSQEGDLTPTEREIVRLLARGLSNAEIACARGRSVHTISNQVASIYHKLGVSSRLEFAGRR